MRSTSLIELTDIMDPEAAEAVAEAIEANRRERIERRRDELGLDQA